VSLIGHASAASAFSLVGAAPSSACLAPVAAEFALAGPGQPNPHACKPSSEEDLFVFNDTIEGPRAPSFKPELVTPA
jgi:hypothetical protein